jgi:hypothetical protein
MYSIPNEAQGHKHLRVEAAHVAAVAPQPIADERPAAAASIAASLVNQSILMEIPDYLRPSGWARYRSAIIGLAALLLVAAAVLFLPQLRGWFGGAAPPSNVATGGGTRTENTKDLTPPPPPTPLVTGSDRTGATPAGQSGTEQPALGNGFPVSDTRSGVETPRPIETTPPPSTGISGSTTLPQTPIREPAANMVGTTPPPESVATTAAPGGAAIGTPPAADAGMTRAVAENVPDVSAIPIPAGPTTPGENIAMPTSPSTSTVPAPNTPVAPIAAVGDGTATSGQIAGPPGATVGTIPPIVESPMLNLGTYLGGKTVLLRYNEKQQGWFRVEPRAAVVVGDRLLALPEFRPRITFTSGLGMDVAGSTLVNLKTADAVAANGLPAGDAKVPAVEIIYGRIVLVNLSADEQRIRLTLGPTTADVRIAKNAILGVQVERKYMPGADPRKSPSPVLADVIAPAGGVVWLDAAGERSLTEPVRWTIADAAPSPPGPLAQPVEWLDREPIVKASQREAAPSIEVALTVDRPVDDQLLEVYLGARRSEVKSLAAQCSMHVGMFVPFVAALRDSEQRPNWKNHIDRLRAAMALNRDSADKVLQTLVDQRGGRAATDLYEMLCGYSMDQVGRTPDQRKSPTGPLSRLINWLSSDNLDYRVLAVENLAEITGKRLMPNPAGSPVERAGGLRDWTKRLAADELISPAAGQ